MLAFIHVAKTGGRTIELILRNTYGVRYAHAVPWHSPDPDRVIPKYEPADLRRLLRIWPPLAAIGGHAVALWSDFDRERPVRWFAFLRDPLKRAASHYQFHAATEKQPRSFEEWLAWDVPRDHQVRAFSRRVDVEEAIAAIAEKHVFIGLLERFDESLVLLRKLVAPELRLGYRRQNTAADNSLAKELLADAGNRERLAELHRQEFRLYDHVVNEIYPRQIAAYGPGLAEDLAALRAAPPPGPTFNDRANRVLRRLWIDPWVHRLRRS
jgi:hypothetical protein